MFENLFGKKELGDDKNNLITFHLKLSNVSSIEDLNALCITNPKKCRKNRREFCTKTLTLLGYTSIYSTDNPCRILQKLMKIKAIVTNQSGTPSKRFVKCIAQHADDELKDFIIRNGYKISEKKSSSCMLLLATPATATVKMNK